MADFDRRQFLTMMAITLATPFAITVSAGNAQARVIGRNAPLEADVNGLFSHSIASGDPSPSGVILWTRIRPDAVVPAQNLYVQVGVDPEFNLLAFEAEVDASAIHSDNDFTVSLDTDGYLLPNKRYYYRFIYGNVKSRVGRCRTAPAYGANNSRLKLAVLTCQDYTNGYYNTYQLIAEDDSIDFVVHLGDFIYETAGDPLFQSLPFEDRLISLPSGQIAAMDLADYRHIYQTYRSDPNLMRAMEQHTFIVTRDDHETANDAYWDYGRHTLGAPDHPYTTNEAFGNSAELLNQLMLDSHRAWLEYIPARVLVNRDTSDPQRYLKYYRKIQLGGLVDLLMLDGRSYRSPHPCGEGGFGERYAPLSCDTWQSNQQTLLGHEQRDWLINEVTGSNAHWQIIGNQTYMGFLGINLGNNTLPLNVDAWDGFDAERNYLAQELAPGGQQSLVVITGDLHTYMASHLKQDYQDHNPFNFKNYFGVEFMTPAVTSAGLMDQLAGINPTVPQAVLTQALSNSAIRVTNPHVRYFNSVYHGYSLLELKPDYCDWKAYAVEKNLADQQPQARLLRHYRKHKAWPWLITKAAGL